MSGTQVFVAVFAVVSVALSALAIWRVARSTVSYKPLWIVGSVFGFVGVATDFGHSGDLYLQLGLQIPVVMALEYSFFDELFPCWKRMISVQAGQRPILKAMFPFIAIAALVKCHSSPSAAAGSQGGG